MVLSPAAIPASTPAFPVRFGVAEFVHFCIVTVFDNAAFFHGVFIGGSICSELAVATDFTQKNLPPGAGHLFGTDWMGRDMLALPAS